MNPIFVRKSINGILSNILYRNRIFNSLQGTTPTQNRTILLVTGPSHPTIHSRVAICAGISKHCLSVFAGYLSAKLAYGIWIEFSTFIDATARLLKRTIYLRFMHAYGTATVMYSNYIAAKFIENCQKIRFFSNPLSQVNFTPPEFTTPEILNNNVNAITDSSKQPILNNNNSNNKSLNPTLFIYFPKIIGRLFSLQNRPLILPCINPNSYAIPRSNPIHRINHITIQAPAIPSEPTHIGPVTPRNSIDHTFDLFLKYLLTKGCQQRKLGNSLDARQIFETAAANKSAEAMYNLGIMSATGEGGGRNLQQAILYMKSASDLGHVKARDMLFNFRNKQNLVKVVNSL